MYLFIYYFMIDLLKMVQYLHDLGQYAHACNQVFYQKMQILRNTLLFCIFFLLFCILFATVFNLIQIPGLYISASYTKKTSHN